MSSPKVISVTPHAWNKIPAVITVSHWENHRWLTPAWHFVAWQVNFEMKWNLRRDKKPKPKQQISGFLLTEANRKIYQNAAFACWSPSSISGEFRALDPWTFSANTVSLCGRKLCLVCGITFVYSSEQLLVAVGFPAICCTAQGANVETMGFSSEVNTGSD